MVDFRQHLYVSECQGSAAECGNVPVLGSQFQRRLDTAGHQCCRGGSRTTEHLSQVDRWQRVLSETPSATSASYSFSNC